MYNLEGGPQKKWHYSNRTPFPSTYLSNGDFSALIKMRILKITKEAPSISLETS